MKLDKLSNIIESGLKKYKLVKRVLPVVFFKKQLEVINCKKKEKFNIKGRRSGKTKNYGGAFDKAMKIYCNNYTDFIRNKHGEIIKEGGSVFIVCPEKSTALSLYFDVTIGILEDLKIGYKTNKLSGEISIKEFNITFRFFGVKDEKSVDKFRGLPPPILIWVDESQSIRNHVLKTFCDKVIMASKIDLNPEVYYNGTPPSDERNEFYQMAKRSDAMFTGNMYENPHLDPEKIEEILSEERKKRGFKEGNESSEFKREILGEFVFDTESNVLVYDDQKNDYSSVPKIGETYKNWRHGVGIDMGFRDADAIAVIAHSEYSKEVYLVHEDLEVEQNLKSLELKIKQIEDEYNPTRIVGDFGSLGLKIGEDFNMRMNTRIEPAEKQNKIGYYRLLNSALLNGTFRARKDSVFAQDCDMLKWLIKNDKVDTRFHSDIIDAVLYIYRDSYDFIGKSVGKSLTVEEKMFEDARKRVEKSKNRENYDNYDPHDNYDNMDF